MKIDINDVIDKIEEIYACGLQEDGTHSRVAFSREDQLGREKFIGYFKALGINAKVDAAGNIIARLEGSRPGLPSIMVGSHLDTVPDGGKYDGVLGCVAGYAICRALVQSGETLVHPIEVIVFTDEEGARFGSGLYGSNAFCGVPAAFAEDDIDNDGKTRKDVMEAAGIDFSKAPAAVRPKGSVHCFLELHIEQGASLHDKGIPIGIVSSIAGVKRYEVVLNGEANHSGSTMMKDRKDALVSAARLIGSVPGIVSAYGKDYTVATVGAIRVQPGSVNVVPGVCTFSLEIRDQDEAVIGIVEAQCKKLLAEICKEAGLTHSFRQVLSHEPAPMSREIKETVEAICKRLDIAYVHMPSGAFHDSLVTSTVFPTGMVFVPSVKGISHSPLEFSIIDDIEKGLEVLYHTVLELDKIALLK